jgi:hypothetical protein
MGTDTDMVEVLQNLAETLKKFLQK